MDCQGSPSNAFWTDFSISLILSLINKLYTIFDTCSFYFCMRVMILLFWKYIWMAFSQNWKAATLNNSWALSHWLAQACDTIKFLVVSKQRVIETWLLGDIISHCWQSWFSLITGTIVVHYTNCMFLCIIEETYFGTQLLCEYPHVLPKKYLFTGSTG